MIKMILNDIIIAMRQFIFYAALFAIIVTIQVLLLIRLTSKKAYDQLIHYNRDKLILIYFIIIYVFMVISITFLSREPGSREGLDLILFSTFSPNIYDNIYPVENVLLFIPLGILLPSIWKGFRSVTWCAFIGLFFSLAIETSQYLTERGFSQIDDIMTNIVGTILGYFIYSIYGACHYYKKIK